MFRTSSLRSSHLSLWALSISDMASYSLRVIYLELVSISFSSFCAFGHFGCGFVEMKLIDALYSCRLFLLVWIFRIVTRERGSGTTFISTSVSVPFAILYTHYLLACVHDAQLVICFYFLFLHFYFFPFELLWETWLMRNPDVNNWYSMVCSFQMYCDPDCKPWTSRSWAPPGYASRQDAEADRKSVV